MKDMKRPERATTPSGQNSKKKSTAKTIINRRVVFVKHKNGSSCIRIPPETTLYFERIAKKLGVEPGVFLSELIQKINLVYEPWSLK